MIRKNRLTTKVACILMSLTLAANITGCAKSEKDNTPSPTPTTQAALNDKYEKTAFKLNTIIRVTIYDGTDPSVVDEAFKLCDTYENLLSRTISTSEIAKLNASPMTPVELSDDVLEVFNAGLKYSKLSNGAFDITVEPITSLWNFSSTNPHVPSKEAVEEAVSDIGYENVIVDGNKVTLNHTDMGIDLGAIAKGYIADKMKDFLKEKGVTSAIINLGGNVLCIGAKPDGTPFNIGIQKPFEDRNDTIAVMELKDVSVVSSGIYERYFVEDGVSYHHILNPKTGYPYDNGLLSVTIISDKSTDGDALSTTCFALGLEKGLELINSLDNTYAVFITQNDELHYSDGFLENIVVKETN